MLSVTADTNIYVSAFEFGGVPRRFLEGAAARDFRLHISEAILEETLRVLRTKFRWTSEELYDAEKDIRSYSWLIRPMRTLEVIQADRSDNRILECAAAAKSDYIVTGDARHILPLGSFSGITILRVADFLRELQDQQ